MIASNRRVHKKRPLAFGRFFFFFHFNNWRCQFIRLLRSEDDDATALMDCCKVMRVSLFRAIQLLKELQRKLSDDLISGSPVQLIAREGSLRLVMRKSLASIKRIPMLNKLQWSSGPCTNVTTMQFAQYTEQRKLEYFFYLKTGNFYLKK